MWHMTLYYYLSDRFAPCLRNKIEYLYSSEQQAQTVDDILVFSGANMVDIYRLQICQSQIIQYTVDYIYFRVLVLECVFLGVLHNKQYISFVDVRFCHYESYFYIISSDVKLVIIAKMLLLLIYSKYICIIINTVVLNKIILTIQVCSLFLF